MPGKETRNNSIELIVVFDNYPGEPQLETSWGFGCVIRGLSQTILFDTGGQGDVLLGNMQALEVRPEEIDAVVLSHIHGDHVGGLSDFLQHNNDVSVFLPAAFPESFKERVRQAGAAVVETTGPREICPGAHTTGVLGADIKEQGLYIETSEGVAVVTGCAHPGVVQIAKAAREASGRPVYAVLGGFHLGGVSASQIANVIDKLKALGVKKAGPCHCSGDETRKMMHRAFGPGYLNVNVGRRISFTLQPT